MTAPRHTIQCGASMSIPFRLSTHGLGDVANPHGRPGDGLQHRNGATRNRSLDRCRNIEAFDSEPKAWFYQEAETDRNAFAVISLWGKFGGLHACGATFSYIVPLPNIFLTRLFSKTRLKRKDFQEIVRLTWAQEVPSSNLGAPTIYFFVFQLTVSNTAQSGAELGSNLDPSTSLFTLSTARPCSSGIACKKISRVVSSAECPNNACIVPFRVPTQSTIVAWLASEDAK